MIVWAAAVVLILAIGWSQWCASKKALYFAYGVNTNTASFKERVPSARCRSNATLEGHEFRWQQHAAILPKAGSIVHGVLWEIDEAELKGLDEYEFNYKRRTVQVTSNRSVSAETYFMIKEEKHEPGIDEYVQLVRQGYEEHGLPLDQLESSKGSSCTRPPSFPR